MVKKVIIWTTIIILSLFIGYKLNYDIGYRAGFSKGFSVNDKCTELVDIKTNKFDDCEVPQCDLGSCPEYEYFDVDEDGKPESIVLERVGMTQQAGRAWIIKDGKVLFKSNVEMQIAVNPIVDNIHDVEKQNGFVISYATETRLSEKFEDSFKSDIYKYKNGEFVLEPEPSNKP